MEVDEIKSWLFQIEPFPGESLSHFLGRFRRSNDLTSGGLAGAVFYAFWRDAGVAEVDLDLMIIL